MQGSSSKHTVGPAVDLLAGALSLAVAAKLLTQRRPAPGAQRAVAGFDGWFHAHARRFAALLAAAVGGYLVVQGRGAALEPVT